MIIKKLATHRKRTASTVSAKDGSALMQPRHRSPLRKRIIISLILVVVLVCLVLLFVRHQMIEATLAKHPTYSTVLPGKKSVDQLGGWQRVSPPKDDPVFAYLDTINGVTISVSEQPLPQAFKKDPASHVAEIAQQGYYTNKITAGTTIVYVGTSTKGPQSAILTKNGLLIFIKSKAKIDDSAWAKYVEALSATPKD